MAGCRGHVVTVSGCDTCTHATARCATLSWRHVRAIRSGSTCSGSWPSGPTSMSWMQRGLACSRQQQQPKAALRGGNNNSTETPVSTTTTFASTTGSSKINLTSSIATSVSLPVFVAADMTFAPAFDEANKQLRASCDSATLVREQKC